MEEEGEEGLGVHMWPGLDSVGGCGAQNKRKLWAQPLIAGELVNTPHQPVTPTHLGRLTAPCLAIPMEVPTFIPNPPESPVSGISGSP